MRPIASTPVLYPKTGDYCLDPEAWYAGWMVCRPFVRCRWQIPDPDKTPIRLHFFTQPAAQSWPVWLQCRASHWGDPVISWSSRQCAKPGRGTHTLMDALLIAALGSRLANGAVVRLWVQCELIED